MFKIGDFSKLSLVSVKALRYYDEINLLRPITVDPLTGYRYYSAEQLPRLNRIIMYKELGLSLEEIAQLIDSNPSSEKIMKILEDKQLEIKLQLDEIQRRLIKVEECLQQIKKEGTMPEYTIQTKKIEPATIVSVRETISTYGHVSKLWEKLFRSMGRNMAKVVGPPIAMYHDPEYKEKDVDIEVAVPVKNGFTVEEPIKISQLPGEDLVAWLLYKGKYEEISQGYQAIMTWIEKNNYEISNCTREIYLRGPNEEKNTDNYLTEIQVPIKQR